VFLYTQKTEQKVYRPVPAFVVAEFECVPSVSGHHWFWTRGGMVETVRKKWSEALADWFTDAKVKDGQAHRFRNTMAVELLKAGTPIERVSILLGHSSVRITEKHYKPWNRARQEQAEADVTRSWATDPVVLLEGKGKGDGTVHHQAKSMKRKMAGTTGLEPATSAVTGQRSNQLNYVPRA
jgi:hypothetical protein